MRSRPPSPYHVALVLHAGVALACGAGTAQPTAPTMASQPASVLQSVGWAAPVNLGVPVNSSASELQVGIGPNATTLYLSSNRAGTFGNQDLWVSHRQPDGTWGGLVNLGPLVNTTALESSPTLSIDGHYLYFSSRRAGGHGGLDCWRAYRENPTDDLGWGTPENLGLGVNSAQDDADCLIRRTENGSEVLWFASLNRPDGEGDWDIYVSELRDGTFQQAVPVAEINTVYRETRMTLSGNGLNIIFSSDRPGGLGGIDLWLAKRPSPVHPFCAAENLGAPVNSVANDRSPSMSSNGLALFFTSTRAGGLGSDDVYMADRLPPMEPRDCTPDLQ